MSIACKNRCEDQVRLTDSLIADNIRNAPYVNKAVRPGQTNRFFLPGLLLGSGLLCLLWGIHDYRNSGDIGMVFSLGVILIIYSLPRMFGAVQASRTQPYSSGFCQRCGYDMRGNLSGKCPECGRKM